MSDVKSTAAIQHGLKKTFIAPDGPTTSLSATINPVNNPIDVPNVMCNRIIVWILFSNLTHSKRGSAYYLHDPATYLTEPVFTSGRIEPLAGIQTKSDRIEHCRVDVALNGERHFGDMRVLSPKCA